MIEIVVKFEEQKEGPAAGSMAMITEVRGAETATPGEKGMSYPLFKAVQGYLEGMAVASGNSLHAEGPSASIKDLIEQATTKRGTPPGSGEQKAGA